MGAAERGYPRPELPSVAAGAVSSAGRAPALHAGGRRFESCTAHLALSPHTVSLNHALPNMRFLRSGAVPGAVLGSRVRRPRSLDGDPQLPNSTWRWSGGVHGRLERANKS